MVDALALTDTTFLDRLVEENEHRPDLGFAELLKSVGARGDPRRHSQLFHDLAGRARVEKRAAAWLERRGISLGLGANTVAGLLMRGVPAWDDHEAGFGVSIRSVWDAPPAYSLAIAVAFHRYLAEQVNRPYPFAIVTIDDAVEGSQHFRGRIQGIIDAGIGGVVTAALLGLATGAASLARGSADKVRDQCARAMTDANVSSVRFTSDEGCVVQISREDVVPSLHEQAAELGVKNGGRRLVTLYGTMEQIDGGYAFYTVEGKSYRLMGAQKHFAPRVVLQLQALIEPYRNGERQDDMGELQAVSLRPVDWPIRATDLIQRG